VEDELEKFDKEFRIGFLNERVVNHPQDKTTFRDIFHKFLKSSLLRIAKEAEKKERERIEKIIRNERKKYWQSSNGADTKAQQTWVLSDLLHKITTNETTK